jgi:pimeloyl-ACP methyl ester carboxylesterase
VVQIVLAALLAVVLGFVVYASIPMTAEAGPLDAVRTNSAISTVETADSLVLSPTTANDTGIGLVFIAGARVEPAAYAAKLSGLAESGVTVAIVRPVLGFAILEWRSLSTFTDLAPGVETWFVGGHSLGGVRACQYLADYETDNAADANADGVDAAPLAGLILFGSYCAADVAAGSLPALSIAGSEDGLSTPDKIADAAGLLPTSTTFTEIDGANHASFGDYGVQPGDGTATATDAEVTAAITAAALDFMTGQ